MIKFSPYKIVINGNDEDDILYEKWYYSESRDDTKKPKNLSDMELQPRMPFGFSIKDVFYEMAVVKKLAQIKTYKTGQLVLAASLDLKNDLLITRPGFQDAVANMNSSPFLFQVCPVFETTASANKNYKNQRIHFSPSIPSGYSCDAAAISLTTDDTLLHELVHGVRPPQQVRQLMDQNTNDNWDNLEEFFAITVQNIYLSERGEKKVRGEHKTDVRTLSATRVASAEFMKNKTNYARIKEAMRREKLAQQLAKLENIPFNPFAEFERAKHDLRSI